MNQPKSSGLGKGLSALIGDNSAPRTQPSISNNTATAPANNAQAELPTLSLKGGKYQPRTQFKLEQLQELADSIAHNGIMQPILVRPIAENQYEIVAGERRWRAAKIAGLQTVPVIIREMTDKVALELALVENIQRADLTPIEEAAGYQRLMNEFEYTQEQLAETVGKSRSHVANLLRLLQLPDSIKDFMNKGELTMGHARALLTHPEAEKLANEIVRRGLSVRQTEALTRRDPEKPMGRPRKNSEATVTAPRKAASNAYDDDEDDFYSDKDSDILALEATLSESLGLKVGINDKGSNQGEITIHYTNLEQLDDVLRRLGGGGF